MLQYLHTPSEPQTISLKLNQRKNTPHTVQELIKQPHFKQEGDPH